MNARDKTEREQIEQLISGNHKKRELMCRDATKNFLYGLWNRFPEGVEWCKENDPIECIQVITRCACLLAKLRGVINIYKDRGEDDKEYNHSVPIVEKPDRLNQLFYNVCRGHALASGRLQIDETDLRFVVKLAMDSAPTTRSKLFRLMIENGGTLTSSQVVEHIRCSRPTALKEMEALRILGICTSNMVTENRTGDILFQEEREIRLREDLEWFLSDQCKRMREQGTTQVNALYCSGSPVKEN